MDTMTHNKAYLTPKIALYEPDIPQNTASIIRTCSCLGAQLQSGYWIWDSNSDGNNTMTGYIVIDQYSEAGDWSVDQVKLKDNVSNTAIWHKEDLESLGFSATLTVNETSDTESYVTGDTISLEHQQMEFGYCYPSDSTGNTFSFAENSGKVFMLEMSASW